MILKNGGKQNLWNWIRVIIDFPNRHKKSNVGCIYRKVREDKSARN